MDMQCSFSRAPKFADTSNQTCHLEEQPPSHRQTRKKEKKSRLHHVSLKFELIFQKKEET